MAKDLIRIINILREVLKYSLNKDGHHSSEYNIIIIHICGHTTMIPVTKISF